MRRVFLTFVFALFAGSTVLPQATIAGRVTDPNGAVWPGAKITLLRESDKLEIQKTTTDSDGEFVFANIPFGILRIRISISGINREFTKRIDVKAKRPTRIDVVFSGTPCSDQEELIGPEITTDDHAEIVRSLVDILVDGRPQDRPVILLPANFSPEWLTPAQRSRVSILPRDQIQELTEKDGELMYCSITKPVQRGQCVGISVVKNLTVKGQTEDANMAGGDDTYEFRKVNGKWTSLHLSSTIS